MSKSKQVATAVNPDVIVIDVHAMANTIKNFLLQRPNYMATRPEINAEILRVFKLDPSKLPSGTKSKLGKIAGTTSYGKKVWLKTEKLVDLDFEHPTTEISDQTPLTTQAMHLARQLLNLATEFETNEMIYELQDGGRITVSLMPNQVTLEPLY